MIAPMLAATARGPFSDPAWLFEVKWDGIRCICQDGHMYSRSGADMTWQFPEVASTLPEGATLDGELIVPVQGIPDFEAVMARFQTRAEHAGQAAARSPAMLVVFDLLALKGRDLRRRPLEDRRALLLDTLPPSVALQSNPAVDGAGETLWQQILARGWEGMMAKRKAGLYQPGRRSSAWFKLKNYRTMEGLIVGARAGGYVVVADPDGTPVAKVLAGVPRVLWEIVRGGMVPLRCTVRHVGRAQSGHLREPSLLRVQGWGTEGASVDGGHVPANDVAALRHEQTAGETDSR